MEEFSNIKKACGFYVSSMHLVTMILPYIRNEINNNNVKIETSLEYNLKENINNIVNKLIINKKEKENILNINWESTNFVKFINFENRFKKIIKKNNKINIIINGNIKYIEKINLILEKILNNNKNIITNKEIVIINLYNVIEFDNNIKEILDIHDLIINTSGFHKIEDVFDDYKKKKLI